MSDEIKDQEIRECAYLLWEDAGSPEGHEHDFWVRAKELLAKRRGQIDIDEAGKQSFPASDPINHM
jgi:hypothetical protein